MDYGQNTHSPNVSYSVSGNRSCAFYIGDCDDNDCGNNKTIQKNVGRNFTNVFNWKSFRNSSAWRSNQRVHTCEFDLAICVYQYGNHDTQNVSPKET